MPNRIDKSDVDKNVEWGIRGSSSTSVAARQRQETKDRVHELVDRSIEGDASAFSAIYDQFADLMFRYFRHHLSGNTTEDAQDLTSLTFLQAWRAIAKFRWRGKPFEAWLFTLAHNQLIDFYRDKRLERGAAPLDEAIAVSVDQAAGPEAHALAVDQAAKTQAALDRLTFEQREVIVLKFFLDQETREIAAITGKREGTVRAMQMRALQALRRQLGDE